MSTVIQLNFSSKNVIDVDFVFQFLIDINNFKSILHI